jgi:hypothetical protein
MRIAPSSIPPALGTHETRLLERLKSSRGTGLELRRDFAFAASSSPLAANQSRVMVRSTYGGSSIPPARAPSRPRDERLEPHSASGSNCGRAGATGTARAAKPLVR